MSEIKPIEFFKPDDFGNNCWMNPKAASDIANEKLAPVLQMMKEMVKQYVRLLKSIPYNYVKPDYCIVHEANLEKYKSFLSQIESEAGE